MKAMLVAFQQTGAEQFLEPMQAAAGHHRVGSDLFGVRGLDITEVLVQYRDLTGDTQYDDIISGSGSEYCRFLLSGDATSLAGPLDRRAALFRHARKTLTSEVRFTDRIFKFKDKFIDRMYNNTVATSASLQLLYSCISGAVADPSYLPRPYIRWWTGPAEASVLVRRQAARLEVRVWGHLPDPQVGSADGTLSAAQLLNRPILVF